MKNVEVIDTSTWIIYVVHARRYNAALNVKHQRGSWRYSSTVLLAETAATKQERRTTTMKSIKEFKEEQKKGAEEIKTLRPKMKDDQRRGLSHREYSQWEMYRKSQDWRHRHIAWSIAKHPTRIYRDVENTTRQGNLPCMDRVRMTLETLLSGEDLTSAIKRLTSSTPEVYKDDKKAATINSEVSLGPVGGDSADGYQSNRADKGGY